jgi:hypothetical protein
MGTSISFVAIKGYPGNKWGAIKRTPYRRRIFTGGGSGRLRVRSESRSCEYRAHDEP